MEKSSGSLSKDDDSYVVRRALCRETEDLLDLILGDFKNEEIGSSTFCHSFLPLIFSFIEVVFREVEVLRICLLSVMVCNVFDSINGSNVKQVTVYLICFIESNVVTFCRLTIYADVNSVCSNYLSSRISVEHFVGLLLTFAQTNGYRC